MMTLALLAYAFGVFSMAIWNVSMIIGPIDWLTIARNALLWPVFLPVLIVLNAMERDR